MLTCNRQGVWQYVSPPQTSWTHHNSLNLEIKKGYKMGHCLINIQWYILLYKGSKALDEMEKAEDEYHRCVLQGFLPNGYRIFFFFFSKETSHK